MGEYLMEVNVIDDQSIPYEGELITIWSHEFKYFVSAKVVKVEGRRFYAIFEVGKA